MDLQQHKAKMMKDPQFKKEWERFDLWLELEHLWLEIRCWFNKLLNSK